MKIITILGSLILISCNPITHGVDRVKTISKSNFDGLVLCTSNWGSEFDAPDGMYTIGDTIKFCK